MLIAALALMVHLIDRLKQIQLLTLLLNRQMRIFQILNDCPGFHILDVHVSASELTWQKGIAPIRKFPARLRPRAHGNEPGKILVLAAKTIGQPRTQTRATRLEMSEIHHQDGAGVFRNVRVHGMNEADVIDVLPHEWKDVANPLAGLSVSFEAEGGRHQPILCIS